MRAHAHRSPARRTRLAARDQTRRLPRPCPRKQGERVKIWSRRGADFTHCFPTIAEAVRGLAADEALIDGEAVVLKDDGRSDFAALMTKRRGAGLARGLRPSASRRRRSAPVRPLRLGSPRVHAPFRRGSANLRRASKSQANRRTICCDDLTWPPRWSHAPLLSSVPLRSPRRRSSADYQKLNPE
jgi:ATP dependent DNA ligase domain